MTYIAAENRYESIPYRRVGRSGLVLPALSLGLWHNFGDSTPIDTQRALLRTAFDLGINHFDLANNYGPPYGSAEINFGRLLREDFKHYRDELIISSKAGWDMWPGPYGQGGGSRKYILASLDQSLQRLGVDYVDIFYSHRFDADTPLGRNRQRPRHRRAARQGVVHRYFFLLRGENPRNRRLAQRVESPAADPSAGLQPAQPLGGKRPARHHRSPRRRGDRVHAVGPGLLTDKYLNGVPADARVNRPGGGSLQAKHLSEANLAHVRALNEIAKRRGQSLAQLALAWTLRDPRVTSALIGASRPEQIIETSGR